MTATVTVIISALGVGGPGPAAAAFRVTVTKKSPRRDSELISYDMCVDALMIAEARPAAGAGDSASVHSNY